MVRTRFVLSFGLAVWGAAAVASAQSTSPVMQKFTVTGREQLTQTATLRRQVFDYRSGRDGWRVRIAPKLALLAPPAVVDGVIYVGGGYDSRRFWALDAQSGRVIWTCTTFDPDPGIPVVANGAVAYIAEGTRVYVRDAKTGSFLWGRQCEGGLTTHVAADDGRLFVSHPHEKKHYVAAYGLRNGSVLWTRPLPAAAITTPVVHGGAVYVATVDGTLTRFDAASGVIVWTAHQYVTTAPRLVAGMIFVGQRMPRSVEVTLGTGSSRRTLSCRWIAEGTTILDSVTGSPLLVEPLASSHAPHLESASDNAKATAESRMTALEALFVFRELEGTALRTLVAAYRGPKRHSRNLVLDALRPFSREKPYKQLGAANQDARRALAIARVIRGLAKKRRGGPAPLAEAAGRLEATANVVRHAAALCRSTRRVVKAVDRERTGATVEASRIGVTNARELWAYQGSRPLIVGPRVVVASRGRLKCFDWMSGESKWTLNFRTKHKAVRPITPPAIAGRNLYVGTVDGHVACIDAIKGKVRWREYIGTGIFGEPIVTEGRVYVVSRTGHVASIRTRDSSATGWPIWGGSAGHNGGPSPWAASLAEKYARRLAEPEVVRRARAFISPPKAK